MAGRPSVRGGAHKLSVSVPLDLWLEAVAAMGLADCPQLVRPSRLIQAALSTFIAAHPDPEQHVPCNCAHCRANLTLEA